jgi:hypothetical protein
VLFQSKIYQKRLFLFPARVARIINQFLRFFSFHVRGGSDGGGNKESNRYVTFGAANRHPPTQIPPPRVLTRGGELFLAALCVC